MNHARTRNRWNAARALTLVLSAALLAPTAFAKGNDDDHPGKGKGNGKERAERRDRDDDRHGRGERHFSNEQRAYAHQYYGEAFRAGHCPPGLAKKHNGCMPPGQAKKWQMGRPLPRDVVVYEVPPQLVVKIGVPPAGYKYVRVAADILMVAVGTNMVVDAITDLSRM